jgi:hypothetical protein
MSSLFFLFAGGLQRAHVFCAFARRTIFLNIERIGNTAAVRCNAAADLPVYESGVPGRLS